MGGGPSVAVFFTLLIAAITTFLYLDRQDQVKYDTLAKNAQRALVEKAVSDLRSPVPTGPSPSNLQKVVGPSPSNLQEDAEPSPVTNTVTSAIETLCDKYPWNDLCKDRPGWTGIKPSDSDPPTPDIPETTPYMAMDVDGNSAVNFPEFFNATSPQIGGAISEDDLFQSFNIIDKNSDGFISEAEFAGTIGPSPIPTDTQPPTNIGPSPETLSSATRSFCEEYPWNSLCKDRPGWTGIKPIYPSVENIEPSPAIIESPPITTDPLPDISTTSMDMLCEQYPWNDLCKDRPGWTGIEPIYRVQDAIGPSPMSTGPSPTNVTSSIDSLCEKYPWNDLCRDRAGWTGVVPNEEFDTGDTTTTSKTSSEKGYEALSSGRYADALIEYTNALSIASDSEKPLLYNNRSIAYMRMGQFDSALRDANNIDATIDTNKLLRYTRTADALYGLERFTEAKNSYQLAVDMNPSSDNLILGLQRAERAEKLTTTTSEEAGTYTFTTDSTQGAYNSALAFTETSGTTQVTENSTERAEQSAVDVLCATTFWHEMCKDRPGWTGTPPDENIPTVDNTVLDVICEPNTGTAPWLEICSYQEGWTGERPVETSDSTQTDVISYTDYSSGLADISQSSGTGVIQETEEQLDDTKDQIPLSKWTHTYYKDTVGGGILFDTFTLSPDSETKANMETCLMKCNEQEYCKGVVFNDTFDRCWGKSSVTETTRKLDRILYTKTDTADGILEPWSQELPTPPTLKWRYVPDTDVDKTKTPWEGDTFHYTQETDIKASPETCITKCAEQSECEGVVFNQENTLCWGMREATVQHTKYSAARNLYRKTYESDGILKPWTQMSITSTVDVETETPDVEPTKWTFEDGVDVISDKDTFALVSPEANFENCIKECDNQSYCKAVVFNDDKTRCWGKLNAVGRRTAADRSLYTKTDDVNGISEPWNFCSNDENILHPMCKTQLGEKCATNSTDPVCKGYTAYDTAVETQLAEKCKDDEFDPVCAGYQAYDAAEAKRQLDTKCATNTTDEECAGYPAYKAARDAEKLDAKCTANPTHPDCAERPGYEEAIAEAIARQNTFWKFKPNYEVRGGDTFHYHKNSDPKANLEVCLRKCNEQGDDCAGVVFDTNEELCWGKRNAINLIDGRTDRRFYQKTLDPSNMKQPWNFCSEKINLSDPYCEPQLDTYCLNEVEDDLCAGYIAYERKRYLDERCATNTTDESCAGYDAYEEAKRQLDEKCETNTTDEECAGYDAYEDAKLDALCTEKPAHSDCADRPGYEEALAESIANRDNTFWKYRPGIDVNAPKNTFHYYRYSEPQASLEACLIKCKDQGDDCAGVVLDAGEEMCWGKSSAFNARSVGWSRKFYEKTNDPDDIKQPWDFCSKRINLSDPYCEPKLNLYCINEDEDDICEGYTAYERKRYLDERCATNTTDESCAGYDAYDKAEAKRELDAKCATNTTDEECEGYDAYDRAEVKRQLDAYCLNEDEDDICAGYDVYDKAEAKRQLDAKCATNTTDEECEGYDAYEAKKQLDEKCATNTTDVECAGYPVYNKAESERQFRAKARANTFWKYRPGIDVSGKWVTDLFHYDKNSDPKASLEVCLNKCTDYGTDCGGVIFDENEELCWGKRKTHVTSNAIRSYWGSRNLYEKTIDPNDINKPWIPTEEQIEAIAVAEEAKRQLDEKCETDTTDPKCAGYDAYEDAKRQLDEKCATNTTDEECAGYDAYDKAEAKRRLDIKCQKHTTDPKCAGYDAYDKAEAKRQLDAKCATNTTDEECEGYDAYDNKQQLNAYCVDETMDEKCVGYDAYDRAEAKRQLDTKCETNTTDEECAGYDLYDAAEAKRQLDTKCATNTTDEECADYVAYKAEMLCGSDDSIRDPLCFIKMCLKKDAPSICEQNPDRDRIRSTAKEIDDEILEELCKDSKGSNGKFKSDAPSACRSTGGKCSSAANGGKCHGNACCSTYNWCSGTTGGQRTAHCAYSDGEGGYRGRNSGKYDGTASRDEADRIARRPANFLDMVYQRVGDTSFCDIPANVLDPECGDYDLAMSIADEVDDEILTELCKDSTWSSGYFKSDTPSACRRTATEWNPDDYDNMQYRCGYGEYGNWYYNGRKWTRNLLKEFGNTKCPNDHCCSNLNWCNRWSTSGQARQDDWCFEPDGKGGYTGRANGKFDGDASRQEADKIARRPADFLDTVYQRVQERKAS